MRKLAKEILFFLWLLEDTRVLLGEEAENEAMPWSLGYEEFTELRPEYAASSWRVQLNRLVRDRLILKQTREKRTTFRLTRLGQERVQQLFFQSLFGESSDILSVILLKPQNGRKTLYSSAHRILQAEGYRRLFTGVYLIPGTVPYTDFLWRSLQKQGFLPLFTQIRAREVRPASIGQLLLDENELYILQGKWVEFSKRADEVLSMTKVRNVLESRDKEEIGTVLVSGLSVLEQWSPLLEEGLASRQEVLTRLKDMREILRKYLFGKNNS